MNYMLYGVVPRIWNKFRGRFNICLRRIVVHGNIEVIIALLLQYIIIQLLCESLRLVDIVT